MSAAIDRVPLGLPNQPVRKNFISTLQTATGKASKFIQNVDGIEKINSVFQGGLELWKEHIQSLSEGWAIYSGMLGNCDTILKPFHFLETVDGGVKLVKKALDPASEKAQTAEKVKYVFNFISSSIGFASFLGAVKTFDMDSLGKIPVLGLILCDPRSNIALSLLTIGSAIADCFHQRDEITKLSTKLSPLTAEKNRWKALENAFYSFFPKDLQSGQIVTLDKKRYDAGRYKSDFRNGNAENDGVREADQKGNAENDGVREADQKGNAENHGVREADQKNNGNRPKTIDDIWDEFIKKVEDASKETERKEKESKETERKEKESKELDKKAYLIQTLEHKITGCNLKIDRHEEKSRMALWAIILNVCKIVLNVFKIIGILFSVACLAKKSVFVLTGGFIISFLFLGKKVIEIINESDTPKNEPQDPTEPAHLALYGKAHPDMILSPLNT